MTSRDPARDPAKDAPPVAPAPLTGDADALITLGVGLCRSARWREAVEPLRRAAQLAPDSAIAHYYLGEASDRVDQLPMALMAYETAAQLDPRSWRALKGIGNVLDRMNRPAEAAVAHRQAVETQRRTMETSRR